MLIKDPKIMNSLRVIGKKVFSKFLGLIRFPSRMNSEEKKVLLVLIIVDERWKCLYFQGFKNYAKYFSH